MDFWYFVHILILVCILSIPLWPLNYLKYGVYIPLFITTLWLLFGGCPLTTLHENSSNSFIHHLFNKYISHVSVNFVDNLSTFLLIFITVIGFVRLSK